MANEPTPALCFDSSALILFLNNALPEPAVTAMQECLQKQKAFLSAVVKAEVLAWGNHTPTTLVAATSLLDVCQLVPVGKTVADEAAKIRCETGLKLPDALIAATALIHSATLVTANGKDFRRVPGLNLSEI